MRTDGFKRGSVVVNRAGKDVGGLFAVLSVDEGGVFVADGRKRKLEHPKKKNPKHLILSESVLNNDEMATNRALRAALRRLSCEL